MRRQLHSVEDPELLARSSHDDEALEALYRRYVRRVAAFAAQRCECADDVADVLSATFDRLFRYADRYDPTRGPVAAFVFAIAGSEVAGLRRREARDQALASRLSGHDLMDGDDVARIEAAIDAASSVAALGPAIETLTPAEGDVLRLVADGLSPGEAATRLGLPPATARTRLSRARRRIRQAAAADGGPMPTGVGEETGR